MSVQPISLARPRSATLCSFEPGEVEKRGAKIFFFEQAHVHLQAAFEQHAHLVFAVGERLADARDIVRMCSATASMCFCLSLPGLIVTSKSRSPMVSRPRRSEPAGVTDSDLLRTLCRCRRRTFALLASRDIDAERGRSRRVLELLGGLQDVLLALFAESGNVAQLFFPRELFDVRDRGGLGMS